MIQSRRQFINRAALLAGSAAVSLRSNSLARETGGKPARFSLRFGPHPGMFRSHAGDDVIDQIKFAADQGFTAWEDNGMPGRPPELQEKIGKTLADLGMTMGVFIAYADFTRPTFARKNQDWQNEILTRMKASVEIAKRTNAKWMTVVPGSIDQDMEGGKYGGPRLAEGYQTANAIDMLRRCTEILEPHDLVIVLEPLNWHANHGGVFLQQSDQAFALCRAVNSPSCKILFDIYHQQITEGNLIPNIDGCWDEIAYFQSGDNPGRKEPGTGEINYASVFGHIARKQKAAGKDMVIGMEHGNSIKGKEGELALIKAYRGVDPGS